jgi:hypothetical protein
MLRPFAVGLLELSQPHPGRSAVASSPRSDPFIVAGSRRTFFTCCVTFPGISSALTRERYAEVTYHSTKPVFGEKVGKLPSESQCHMIDIIVRPYRITLFARKANA